MEFLQTLLLFIWIIVSMETGIIMWARSTLTSKESSKDLIELTFKSSYRFLWLPKLVLSAATLICFMVSYYAETEPNRVRLAIIAFFLMSIHGVLVFIEAVRTKE